MAFGTDITLVYDHDLPVGQQLSVNLSRLNNEFVLKAGGEGYLDQFGIDLADRPSTVPEPEEHMLGSMLLKAAPYGIKYELPIRLQQLSTAKFEAIERMVSAQQRTGKLIRLDNRVLQLTEYGGRTRPIAPGSIAPVVQGQWTTYFASFLVWIRGFEVRSFQGEGRSSLWFKAEEFDRPLTP